MDKRQILTAAILAVGGFGLVTLPATAQDAGASGAGSSAAGQSTSGGSSGATGAGSAGQSSSGGASGSSSVAAGGASAQTAGSSQQASQSDVRQILSQTASAVLTKGGIQQLSQQISQQDQQRVGDLSQQAQQLDQTVDQLRQAYKDKYQKDLDLTANAEQVFTSQFFSVGGASASDLARQAAGTISPDASSTGGSSAGGSSAGGLVGPVGVVVGLVVVLGMYFRWSITVRVSRSVTVVSKKRKSSGTS